MRRGGEGDDLAQALVAKAAPPQGGIGARRPEHAFPKPADPLPEAPQQAGVRPAVQLECELRAELLKIVGAGRGIGSRVHSKSERRLRREGTVEADRQLDQRGAGMVDGPDLARGYGRAGLAGVLVGAVYDNVGFVSGLRGRRPVRARRSCRSLGLRRADPEGWQLEGAQQRRTVELDG